MRGLVYAVLPFSHSHVIDDVEHLLTLTMWIVRHVALHAGAATGGHAAALCRGFTHARLLMHTGDSTCPSKAPQRARWVAPSIRCLQKMNPSFEGQPSDQPGVAGRDVI